MNWRSQAPLEPRIEEQLIENGVGRLDLKVLYPQIFVSKKHKNFVLSIEFVLTKRVIFIYVVSALKFIWVISINFWIKSKL